MVSGVICHVRVRMMIWHVVVYYVIVLCGILRCSVPHCVVIVAVDVVGVARSGVGGAMRCFVLCVGVPRYRVLKCSASNADSTHAEVVIQMSVKVLMCG